jgi:hypothetical protein
MGLGVAVVLAASFLVVTPLTASALGNTYYVTTSGTATAACTVAAPCTIAHALTLAGDGDTISVAAGTYTNTAAISITKGVTINGAGQTATLINGNGSAATVKVGLATTDTTPVTISGVTIQDGKAASGGGGGIDDTGGALTVSSSTITANTTGTLASGGGGIFTNSTGPLTLAGDTISNNTSAGLLGGGGLLLEGPAVITDTTISGNSTTAGAGVGGGILIYKSSTAQNVTDGVTDSTITSNGATYGAGVAVDSASADSGASLSLTGDASGVSTVSSNTAATAAGGLLVTGANTVNVTDSTITKNAVSNTTAGTGGGIDAGSGSILNLVGDGVSPNVVSSNTAVLGAGVAVTSGGTADMSDTGITANTGAVGGGLYVATGGAATLKDGSIATNVALDGGGVAVDGSVSLIGVSVTNNVADADGTANLGDGGGVLDSGTLSITAGSTLSGNQAIPAPASTDSVATGWGGAVFAGPTAAGQAPTFTLSNSAVNGGTLSAADPYNAAEGGGIAIAGNVLGPVAATPYSATSAAFTGAGDTFSGLSALAGGAAYIGGSGTFTGSTITGNSADLFGGGLLVGQGTSTDSPSATVDSTTISSNTAPAGGGIFLNLVSSLTVQNGTVISGNTATTGGDGGGILNEGALTITNSSLTSNTATPSSSDPTTTGFGGAIFSGASTDSATTTAVLSGDTFSGNTAGTASALATLSSGTSDVNNTSIINSTFNANNTTPSYGAIDADEPISIVSSTIDANTSPKNASGGIVVAAAGSVSVAGSDVTNNSGGNCTGAVVDGGYNFTSASDTSCGFTAADHDSSGDPQLGALAANGGLTDTELPGPSSPLINQIPAATATGLNDAVSGDAIVLCGPSSVDQRGNARPSGTNCDIGSVEVTVVAPMVSGPSAATFVVGQAGTTQDFTATGTPTATISESGALPSGVTFTVSGDAATLFGTPAAGTVGSYPITVTGANGVSPNATLAFTLTVDQVPSAISGPSSDTFVVNATGSDTFTATGTPTPTISESGALPGGVTFNGSVPGTGTLSGTAAISTQGAYPLTITASNGEGTATTKSFTLTVVPPVSITTTSLPEATATVPYSTTLAASGGKTPYTWSLSSGTLPAGLTLSSAGIISGTPSGVAGTATFVVKVTDSASPNGTATQSLSITTVVKAPTKLVVSPLLLNPPLVLTLNTAMATLTGGSPLGPLSGQAVVFTAGSTTLCTAMTNASGLATCSYSALNLVAAVLSFGVTATYAGNGSYLPSSGSAGLL